MPHERIRPAHRLPLTAAETSRIRTTLAGAGARLPTAAMTPELDCALHRTHEREPGAWDESRNGWDVRADDSRPEPFTFSCGEYVDSRRDFDFAPLPTRAEARVQFLNPSRIPHREWRTISDASFAVAEPCLQL